MLIGAGSETTTNLLSGLLLTLAQRPDVFTQLREHPELIPAAMRNSCVLSHRCKASTAAPPATTPSVRKRSRPAHGCCWCSPRQTAIRGASTTRHL